jgi:hypothetical protein
MRQLVRSDSWGGIGLGVIADEEFRWWRGGVVAGTNAAGR